MTFEVLTLFPKFFESFFSTGLIQKAIENNIFRHQLVDIRLYGEGKTKRVDEMPYGGLAGMLLKAPVLKKAYETTSQSHTIFFSPRGKKLDQEKVSLLSKKKKLVLICGHYEGVDQRFINQYVDEEISIGDYILSGGETASLVLMESVVRTLDCFLGNKNSLNQESFEQNLLEYDQYTRPSCFNEEKVPFDLCSGHHQNTLKWLEKNRLVNTYKQRSDLWKQRFICDHDLNVVKEYLKEHHFVA